MKSSRIAAIVLVLGAGTWIASGSFGKDEPKPGAAGEEKAAAETPRFKVAVMPAKVEPHARRVTLSGRTEADRKAPAVARASGVIVELRVERGSVVKAGDIVAVLSDEARQASVAQAEARVAQRKLELRARMKLIETGNMAAINRPQLEADYKAAEATLAQAEAEADKGNVRAPISGVVNDVPVQIGQALQATMQGVTIADVIALNPMLAVIEVAERQLAGVHVGEKAEVRLVTGRTVEGTIRFISRQASQQTRTYRVEVAIDNPDNSIADGLTAEVDLMLAPEAASRVPRSALTFSNAGKLGVRVVGDGDKVVFVPVKLVEDGPEELWLGGIPDGARVIVQGQDFVKEGQVVQPVSGQLASAN
jgi:multidrug efflux system membrane fusion protein